jgi:hypothetical protein
MLDLDADMFPSRAIFEGLLAERDELRARLTAALASLAELDVENERLRTELDSEHLEYSLSLTNRDLRAEVSRLRAAITEALGGADCLPDHNMAEFCGWCMLREALSGDQAQHPGDQIQHEHGADPTQ